MDLSCPICTELLCRPVTTPCGHSFCKLCLELALSTKPYCPICREPCPFPHLMKVAIALNAVIESNFSALNAARVVDLTQAVARIRRLVIGNTYEAMPRGAAGQHKWKLYVRMLNVPVDFSRGSQVNASEFVEKIEVHLHSTFVPSMVELTSEPFEVERVRPPPSLPPPPPKWFAVLLLLTPVAH